jgi:hypothetical protein
MIENDQWKLDGNCSKFRRQKYCGNTCTAKKKATERVVKKYFMHQVHSGYSQEVEK